MSQRTPEAEAAYQRGRQLGHKVVAALAAMLGLPAPPIDDAAAEPDGPVVPLDPMAVAVRLQSVIAADLARLSPGMVVPDALAEALFHTAIHVTLACRATGGPRIWAAGALLATCGEDVDAALATLLEVKAEMRKQTTDEDGAAMRELRAHPFKVIKGGKP